MNDKDQIARYRVNGFYFEQLEVDEQMEYKRIASAVTQYAPAAEIEVSDSIERVCSAIQLDNPELFFWNAGEFKLHDDGKLELKYNTTDKKDAEGLVRKVRQVRRDIIEKLMSENENTDKKEFLKKIYFYLCNNRYAGEEFEKKKPRAWLYTIRGALLNGMCTSLGLALAWDYLLEMIGGIDTILMTGTVLRNGKTAQNAWNLVRLDGKYYHIDIGNQMTDKTDDPEAYFLLKDENLNELGYEWSAEVYPQA